MSRAGGAVPQTDRHWEPRRQTRDANAILRAGRCCSNNGDESHVAMWLLWHWERRQRGRDREGRGACVAWVIRWMEMNSLGLERGRESGCLGGECGCMVVVVGDVSCSMLLLAVVCCDGPLRGGLRGDAWKTQHSVSKRSLSPRTGDTGAERRVGTDERFCFSAVLWSVCAKRARTSDQQTRPTVTHQH